MILAADGAEAVAVFARHQTVVGLVLTDMDMPIMDGRATIATLRRLQPQLPIVAMTGTAHGNAAGEPERLDVQATLVKPIARHDLLGAVHELLDT